MALVLSIIRCPENIVPEERRILGGTCVIGRDASCDWVLEDEARVLSKRHCVVEFLAGDWHLRDLSTNGTFVNSAATALGRDEARMLRSGDRLRLGAFEIDCLIQEEAGEGAGRWEAAVLPPATGIPVSSDDPFAAAADFHDPPALQDHLPGTQDAFLPPRASIPAALPEDWDTPSPAAASGSANPFDSLPDPFADGPPGLHAEPLPRERPVGDPFADDPLGIVAAFPAEVERAPSCAASPSPAERSPASAAAPTGMHEAAAILLAAAGLQPPKPGQDPQSMLERAGQALRDAVAGLRGLLVARAQVKREFRIEQTMLQASRNNALKFAFTDEAALESILAPRSEGAIREAVSDLSAHELATISATQAAARALLARLAPGPIERAAGTGGLLGSREKRIWDAYCKLHREMEEQFDDDFDSAFGKAFARAYEQALQRND